MINVNLNKTLPAKLSAPAGGPSIETERLEFGENAWKQPISTSARCVSTPLAKQQPFAARFLLASTWKTFVRTYTTRKHETLTAASVCAEGCHRCVGVGGAKGRAARSRVASVSRSLAASLARRRSSGGRWVPSWVAGSLVLRTSTSRLTRPIDFHPSRVSDCDSVSILYSEWP